MISWCHCIPQLFENRSIISYNDKLYYTLLRATRIPTNKQNSKIRLINNMTHNTCVSPFVVVINHYEMLLQAQGIKFYSTFLMSYDHIVWWHMIIISFPFFSCWLMIDFCWLDSTMKFKTAVKTIQQNPLHTKMYQCYYNCSTIQLAYILTIYDIPLPYISIHPISVNQYY